jgi:N-acetylmuramoyl-L-alanine amidase
MRLLRAVLLLLLLSPAVALAAEPTIVSRDVPIGAARATAGSPPGRFNLVGLHWQGPGSVSFRTRAIDGGWSRWRPAAPEAEDRPDRGSAEAAREVRWKLGNPYWAGASDRIEYRLRGRVTRLRAHYVWSPVERVPVRAVSIAGSPRLLTRFSWGANERIRRARPVYANALRFALVHHTAGANNYGPAQSAAIVRAIQLYHVRGNGWNDVGYNFLVDKYGQVFEGRYGGIARNVVGAHAEGFNTGSVGVAVLGTYTSAAIPRKAFAALAGLLAWRLDVAHVNPVSNLTWLSSGNPRFPAGVPVFLRTVSGHRDTGFTSCPGNALYGQLSSLGARAAAIGLPKLYSPRVRGTLGARIRFTGRLTAPLPWTVTVRDALGKTVAVGTGTGSAVDWTWDSAAAGRKAHTYRSPRGRRDRREAVSHGPGAAAQRRLDRPDDAQSERGRTRRLLDRVVPARGRGARYRHVRRRRRREARHALQRAEAAR